MDTDHGGGGGGGVNSAAGFDDAEAAFFARRGRRCCCCFPWPSPSLLSSSSSQQQRLGGAAAAGSEEEEESWWRAAVDAVLKVREWSELAAGPRWKTFIRRFGRGGPRLHHLGRKLNYDALSYALNFDEGHGATPESDHAGGYRGFSARYAAPLASAKSSMDLGDRDAAPLFSAPPQPPPDGAGRA